MILGKVCLFRVSGMPARNRWTARSFFPYSTQLPLQGGFLSGQIQ
jgi:hypothetical protein